MTNTTESAAIRESVGYVGRGNQPRLSPAVVSECRFPKDRDMKASPPNSRIGLTLFVNGEPQTLTPPCSIADLLETLEMSGRRVAVAVNRNVVVRSRYKEAKLADGDRIEILEAVGGG